MFQILIADDEPNIREGVRQFITRRCPEWQVVGAARDGKEALAMAERFLPDCIMTDITMPHVNGLEFLEKIKEELPDAKLLILSGYDDFEYAVQGMRLGVSDYLLKPLDTELLIQRLDAVNNSGRIGCSRCSNGCTRNRRSGNLCGEPVQGSLLQKK